MQDFPDENACIAHYKGSERIKRRSVLQMWRKRTLLAQE